MGADVNPRIGVIADTFLQGSLLANAAKALGYEVVVSTQPANLDTGKWVGKGLVECWLVDLHDQEAWAALLDLLLDQAEAPLIFGDGQAPPKATEDYPRWERRLFQTLIKSVGRPVSASGRENLSLLEKTMARPRASIVIPNEFKDPHLADGAPERVWVLGASAGGPAAVKLFLDSLPKELPVAFVLAQHIDPKMLETLSASLVRHNWFKIRIGRDGEPLRYGEIVVAPCDAEITFDARACVQSTGKPWEGPYAPSIDQTIANVTSRFGAGAGAILFSGMGNDGSIAAPLLKARGGTVWAQSAETCAVSSQPDSVRDTGCVGYSGSPELLAQQLIEFVRQQLKSGTGTPGNSRPGAAAS
ncbi:MAG: chemotaxis protein CheB [Pseudomonadota bacterium]